MERDKTKPVLVALYAPYRGAGKSTAAKYLSEILDAEIIPFAKDLSVMVNNLLLSRFGPAALAEGKDNPLPAPMESVRLRDFMIAIGQAARSVYPDIWVDLTRRDIEAARIGERTGGPRAVIVDDLRMPNEYAMLRGLGAVMVRITRPGVEMVTCETEAQLEGPKYEWDAQLVNEAVDVVGLYECIGQTLMPLVRGRKYGNQP